MKHIELAVKKRIKKGTEPGWSMSRYYKGKTADLIEEYFSIVTGLHKQVTENTKVLKENEKYAKDARLMKWIGTLSGQQASLARVLHDVFFDRSSLEVVTWLAKGERTWNLTQSLPTPSEIAKAKALINAKTINTLLPPKPAAGKRDLFAKVRPLFAPLVLALNGAIQEVEEQIRLKAEANKQAKLLPQYAKKVAKLFKDCGYTEVVIQSSGAPLGMAVSRIGKPLEVQGTSPEGATIALNYLTLLYDFDEKTIRLDGMGDSGFISPVNQRRYTFDRPGVDAAWYPSLDMNDLSKLKSQILEEKKRSEESIKRHQGGSSINFGPKSVVLSPDEIDRIVQKLKAGQSYTLHPAGFGYAYTFSTKKSMDRYSPSVLASDNLSKLVGSPVYYTQTMMD